MPHPVREFLDAGITVTLSSDDPAFFGSSLLDEYVSIGEKGLSQSQLVQLARNSFTASFAQEAEKLQWLSELDAYLLATKKEGGNDVPPHSEEERG